MKIIDEKGRIFGKINVIDFLVVLFLLCLIPMFYFGYELFKKPTVVVLEPKEFIDIVMDCKFIKVSPGILKQIAVGDKEFDENGSSIGEIVRLGAPTPYQYRFDIGIGEAERKEDPVLKEVPARLKVKAKIKGNSLYYGDNDKQITINSPIEFKTDKYTISAIPVSDKEKTEKIELDIFVTLKGLDERTLKLISVGDRELDAKGDVVVEILSIGKIDINTRDIKLGGGMFVQGEDNSKKQISVKMRINGKMQDDVLYFKGECLAYNSLFEFKTDKYTAKGKIAKILETPTSTPKEIWMSLNIKLTGVIPEIAKIIAVGDTEKYPSGKTVGILRQIISNKPSDVLTLKEDRFITLAHPFQKDIIVVSDFLCSEKDGITYFKNYPVRMGNSITFTTDLYSISGTIVGLESK